MSKIFINYRRNDTKSEARLLYQSLVERFPEHEIIMDIDAIPPAVDFRDYLHKAVENCDIFLVLVGPHWAAVGAIDDARDWVRIEIEAALLKNKKIMPIMVNGGKIPSPEGLPQSVRPFAFRNGLPLDTGLDFNFHVNRIATWIERLSAESPRELGGTGMANSKESAGQVAAVNLSALARSAVAGLALVGAVGLWNLGDGIDGYLDDWPEYVAIALGMGAVGWALRNPRVQGTGARQPQVLAGSNARGPKLRLPRHRPLLWYLLGPFCWTVNFRVDWWRFLLSVGYVPVAIGLWSVGDGIDGYLDDWPEYTAIILGLLVWLWPWLDSRIRKKARREVAPMAR